MHKKGVSSEMYVNSHQKMQEDGNDQARSKYVREAEERFSVTSANIRKTVLYNCFLAPLFFFILSLIKFR